MPVYLRKFHLRYIGSLKKKEQENAKQQKSNSLKGISKPPI